MLSTIAVVCAFLRAAPQQVQVAPGFWSNIIGGGDWLVLNGTSACLNHDLTFATCGRSSLWSVSDSGVRCGSTCLVRAGRSGIRLEPCDAAQNPLHLRDGYLCAGPNCRRCVAAPFAVTTTASRNSRCGTINLVRRPTFTFRVVASVLLLGWVMAVLVLVAMSTPAVAVSPESMQRACDLMTSIRSEPQISATNESMIGHPIAKAADGGYLHLDTYRTFVLEQYHIVASDMRAMRDIAKSSGGRAARLFGACASAESRNLRELVKLAEALGLDRQQLESYEPMCAAHSYATYMSTLAQGHDPAIVAGALLLTVHAFGSLCASLARGLQQCYSVSPEATAFLDSFGDAKALDAFEADALEVLAEGLEAGVPTAEVHRAAHMLQGYELSFWDSVHKACDELPEPVLRGRQGRAAVDEASGLSLHYTDAGPRDGPVVLLVHGWPDSLHSWRLLTPLLDPRLRVISVSLRGFGDSWLSEGAGKGPEVRVWDPGGCRAPHALGPRLSSPLVRHHPQEGAPAGDALPDPPFSLDNLVEDMRVLLGRLAIHQVAIVGHSLGSLVARLMAAEAWPPGSRWPPVKVTKMVLLASPPLGEKNHVAQKLLCVRTGPSWIPSAGLALGIPAC